MKPNMYIARTWWQDGWWQSQDLTTITLWDDSVDPQQITGAQIHLDDVEGQRSVSVLFTTEPTGGGAS